jgi:hypothetical protein
MTANPGSASKTTKLFSENQNVPHGHACHERESVSHERVSDGRVSYGRIPHGRASHGHVSHRRVFLSH